MTEVYLDLAGMTKYYGDARVIEAEHDDLSERSTISQMPLNFGLITEFKNQGDLTADKVIISFFKKLYESLITHHNGRLSSHF